MSDVMDVSQVEAEVFSCFTPFPNPIAEVLPLRLTAITG